jgi:hypothetical protein
MAPTITARIPHLLLTIVLAGWFACSVQAQVGPVITNQRVMLVFRAQQSGDLNTVRALESSRAMLGIAPQDKFYTLSSPQGRAGKVFVLETSTLSAAQVIALLRQDNSIQTAEVDRPIFLPELNQAHSANFSIIAQDTGQSSWFTTLPDYQEIGGPAMEPFIKSLPAVGDDVVIVNADSGIDPSDARLLPHMPQQGWGLNWADDQGAQDIHDPGINQFSHGQAVCGQEIKATADDPHVRLFMERIFKPMLMPDGSTEYIGFTSWLVAAFMDIQQRIASGSMRVAAVNLSIGGFESLAIRDTMIALGVPVFVAAGNGLNNTHDSPGINLSDQPGANAIGAYASMAYNCSPVGALRTPSAVATFSNFGALVKLWGPADGVTTLALNNGLGSVWGTSFAAPIFAGSAAEQLLRNSRSSAFDVINQLEATGDTKTLSVGAQTQTVVELRLDNALGQSPPLPTPQQASLNGKPKYRTSTSTLSLSGTTSGETLVVIPGYHDSAGWFGALKSQDGNFQFSGTGPDPGGRLTITSKAAGSDTKKCKHPF